MHRPERELAGPRNMPGGAVDPVVLQRGLPGRNVDRAQPAALIVDDDVAVRALLAELLEEEGFNVSTASNGFSGLRLATEQHPQVMLLDLLLPDLSGEELLQELRADRRLRDLAVVVVSGNAGMLSASQLAQADAVVRKPFDTVQLMTTVWRVLRRSLRRASEVRRIRPVMPDHPLLLTRRTSAQRRARGRRP
jgi:CheY-like chemotaxis protein